MSAAVLLIASGQAMAQQAAPGDKPPMAFQAAPAAAASAASIPPPSTPALPAADAAHKAVHHKVAKHKATAKHVKAPEAEKVVEAAKPADELKFVPPLPGEVTVSDRDLNRFVFSAPITKLVFPPHAPIEGAPEYLANNTQVLVKVSSGVDKPIQMLVELDGQKVVTLYLKPRPINGVTYRHEGAHETTPAQADAKPGDGAPAPRGEDIELLKHVVAGNVPPEFEPIALPRPTRFDKFTVVPLSGWSDGSRRVLVFSLVAVPGKSAVVASPQFYRQGITAVMLTGDHVDESTNPQLYVVEEVPHDE